jgi:hypothetical protein
MLKIKKIAAVVLVLALAVGGSGCQVGDSDIGLMSEAAVSEVEVLVSASEKEVTVSGTGVGQGGSETEEVVSETINSVQDNEKVELVSVEYELDLDKLRDDKYYDKYYFSLRDELYFLDDEQFEVYIRALIFISKIEFSEITITNSEIVRINDENNKTFVRVANYQSFYDYLQSVFIGDSVNALISRYNLLNIDGVLCFNERYRGTLVYYKDGKYELISVTKSKISFKYCANYSFENILDYNDWEENYRSEYPQYIWTEEYNITLINTVDGWRVDKFIYWS